MSPPSAAPRISRIAALSTEDSRLLVESVSDYAIFILEPDGRVATWNLNSLRARLPAVESVRVGRSWPHTVAVDVTEPVTTIFPAAPAYSAGSSRPG